jgi:hypothetical protein
MVISASSARRLSCFRSSLRKLSENCVTSLSSGFGDATTFRAGWSVTGAAAAGLCVGSMDASAERSAVTLAERVKDLFGHWTNVYRIVRRSNVFEFRDPLPCAEALNSFSNSSKLENPTGHEIQELHSSTPPPIIILDPENQLDAALIRFGKDLSRL